MPITEPPRPASVLATVTAGDAMHPGVLTVAAGASLESVARIMVAQGVHAVLVRPRDERALGWPSRVVTDLSVVRWAAAGAPPATAGEAAFDPAGLLLVDEPLDAAVRAMVDLEEAHLLVADNASRLPDGVLSSFDVCAVLGGRDPRVARLVRPGPARPARSESRLDHVSVRDAMHSGIVACSPRASLTEAAASIADHRVHCVAVGGVAGDAGGERLVWGIVDTMDVVRAVRRDSTGATAASLARTDAVAIEETESMLAAAQAMAERDVSHLVVADDAGAPVGVVSSLDVAAICAIAAIS